MDKITKAVSTLDGIKDAVDGIMDNLKGLKEDMEKLAQGKFDKEMDERFEDYEKNIRRDMKWYPQICNTYNGHREKSYYCFNGKACTNDGCQELLNNYWKTKEIARQVSVFTESIFRALHKGHDISVSVLMEDGGREEIIRFELGEVTMDMSKEC